METNDTLPLLRCRSGNAPPAPMPVELPTLTNKDAALERFEGMLVTINGPLTATNNFNLGAPHVQLQRPTAQ